MNDTKAKNKVAKKIFITIIIIFCILAVSSYISSSTVRDWVDIHILKKEVMEDELNSIELDTSKKNYVYAYGKYIVVLNNNILKSYISSGFKSNELEVNITNPVFSAGGKYLCVAENNGSRIYLVSGDNVLWQKDIDGDIFRIDVNKNGYVTVIAKGNNYQNIIYTIDKDGNDLFNMYISATMIVKAKISNDNSTLAVAEVDTSGTIIKTKVKTISIENAQKDPANSITRVYEGENNHQIIDIEYQEKNNLVCMYDDHISMLENGHEEKIIELKPETISADINLKESIVEVQEENSKVFSTDTKIFIKNINNKNENTYIAENSLKKLYTKGNIIIANMGNKAYVINAKGKLVKKYISKQEIQDIVIGDSIVGIIYKNKIELFNI